MTSKGRILITGGTGLVGSHLIPMLQSGGYEISLLSRSNRKIPGVKVYQWNPDRNEIDSDSVVGVTSVIHLAGAGIGDKRWTEKRKQEILDSRVTPVRLLAGEMEKLSSWPESFISASGINYYDQKDWSVGHSEQSPPADTFLAHVVKAWEKSADLFALHGVRTVQLRTGLVLDSDGGALPKMVRPVQLGTGAALGTGKQRVSWIHVQDLCRIYCEAVGDSTYRGPYNSVAPECVSNEILMKTIARQLDKPFWPIRVPSFLLKAALGEMASLLLEGSCSINKRLAEETGFQYQFTNLQSALEDLYPKHN